jgi:DNA polymerase III epsilon subunit-like protein
MAYFAFDTETTGLPATRAKPNHVNIAGWDNCRMLSMAIVEFDAEHKILESNHVIVYPDNFEVAATEIHGISKEQAEAEGKPFEDVINTLRSVIERCPKMVGHNLEFDLNIVKAEVIRRGIDGSFLDQVEPICTLKMVKDIYFKPMKLGVIYEKLFGKQLEGAHNALADSVAAGEVYAKLLVDPRVYKELPVRKVIIKASDVAACVGLHSYKSRGEVLDEMWKKNHPINFTGETREDRNLKALEHSEEAQQLLKAVLNHKPKDSDEVKEIVSLSCQIIQQDEKLTKEQKGMVCEHLRKMMYTTHGTNSEDTTADLDEATLHKDETFYNLTVANIKGTEYRIVGRIDRYQMREDGTKVLVEIKNRTNGLFNKVRLYEMVQVQTYLQMMDLQEARLVEQFNQERKHYMIERDQKSWEENIHPKLVEFCKTLHHSMSN